MPGRERRGVRRARRDLDADHLDLRPLGLDRDRDAGREPAAADRHHDPREVGDVLEQLEPERALPGDDRRVVERVDEREAAVARPRLRGLEALLERGAADVDDRALAARGLRLGDRRVGGDEHLAAHAARGGRGGEALGVVAGRGGDHAARALRPRARRAWPTRRGP